MNTIVKQIKELQFRANRSSDTEQCMNHGFNILDLIIEKRDEAGRSNKRHYRNAGERLQEAIDAFEYQNFEHGIEKCRQAIEHMRKINETI